MPSGGGGGAASARASGGGQPSGLTRRPCGGGASVRWRGSAGRRHRARARRQPAAKLCGAAMQWWRGSSWPDTCWHGANGGCGAAAWHGAMRRRRRPGGSGMRPSDGGADAAASVCMCGCEGQATALLDRATVARPSEGAVRSGSGGVLPCGGSSARPCDSEAAGGAAHDGAAGRGPGGAAG
uniref:Uncharacterized protein n=1 Tax=Oryza nivara TaxID=4536 RepID=A0A0E0J0X3_ORYNI